MNRLPPSRHLLIWPCLLGILSCTPSSQQTVLARVGSEKIRIAEFLKAYREEAPNFDEALLKDPEGNLAVKRRVLNGLIEETLLFKIAREKEVNLTTEEEKTLVAQIKTGYSEGEWERMLEKKKISKVEWMERQKWKKKIEKMLDQEVFSKIQIDPAEVEAEYRKFPQRFREPDRVRCRHIVTHKEEKARTILSLLEKGEPFAVVAQKYSEGPERDQGGDLGFIARGDYPAIFEQACFTLATGQTSDVLRSPYGFHIFRVLEKKPGRQLSLEEASPVLSASLRDKKGQKALGEWLDELHRNEKIEVDEEALKKVSLEVPK